MRSSDEPHRIGARLAILAGIFALALVPRLYSAMSVGWHWDHPGSFTLINFDEAGSCRAALQGFEYSTLVGRQTIALTSLLGYPPAPGTAGDAQRVRSYCHGTQHILVARGYAAVTGALTAVVVAILGLLLRPEEPRVGWTAGTLLAVSGFHISESHSGTVDAPSVFFIYLFLLLLIFAVVRKRRGLLLASPLLLVAAVWTKYWVFAVLAYAAFLPQRCWLALSRGWRVSRLLTAVLLLGVLMAAATNSDFHPLGLLPILLVLLALVPWQRLSWPQRLLWLLLPMMALGVLQLGPIQAYTASELQGRFGSGYAAIGWHKWLRNLLNVPAVLLVGLGLPAFLFLPLGLRRVLVERTPLRGWLCGLPIIAFALYMLLLAPVTYYRHYLALIPAAALLAACGLWASRWGSRRWFVFGFFFWPVLLAVDVELDYHQDPRIALRQFYTDYQPRRVFISYYVSPPAGSSAVNHLFTPEYAASDDVLGSAQYLILSENWYDTAFANELNGPMVGDLSRLVKTRPEYARFYRQVIAGEHPRLQPERLLAVRNFMPELLLHRWMYGTFQMFVGDVRVFKVLPP